MTLTDAEALDFLKDLPESPFEEAVDRSGIDKSHLKEGTAYQRASALLALVKQVPHQKEALYGWIEEKRSAHGASPSAESEAEAVPWPADDPAYPWKLADRKEEFQIVRDLLAGRRAKRILLLCGSSSSGKTRLVSEIWDYATHVGVARARLDFKGCPTLDELFESMRVDIGDALLPTAFEAEGTSRSLRIVSDLQKVHVPLLLLFDTYEQASDDARIWLENQFLPRLDRAPGVVVVVGGQQVPARASSAWQGFCEQRDMKPIVRSGDWLEFAKRTWTCPGLKEDDVKVVTLATKGDPALTAMLLENLVFSELQASTG